MKKNTKRVLFIATVVKTHIMTFHIPYLKMFKEMGYETAVAARNDYEDPNDCCIPYCDHFFDIPFQRDPFHFDNFHSYKKLKLLIDEGEFSIIHCHTPVGGILGRLAARKAQKTGTRVVYTAHGFHFYKGAPLKNWILYYTAERICARFTDILITINKEDFLLAQKKMRSKHVKYVSGVGIDIAKFSNKTVDKSTKRKELGVPEDAVLLLSVGELIPRKNHETCIRAIADKDVYYIIAGDGVLHDHLQGVIDELDINNRVRLLGYRKDVKELYEIADIFVFPSFQEGLPVAVMEAMASGTPIVASGIRGNVDLIEDNSNGFLCDPNKEAEFADKIQALMNDPYLNKTFQTNSLTKIQEYDINNVKDQLASIYKECLEV